VNDEWAREMKLILQIAVVVQCLALLVWVGGMIFFAFVAAPLIFQQPVQELTGGTHVPGMIVNAILRRFTLWQSVCAVLLLVALAEQARQVHERRGRLLGQFAAAVVMAVILVWCGWIIGSRMQALRAEIGDFNTAPADLPARVEFDALHHRYVALMGLNMVLGLGLFVASVVLIPSVFRERDRGLLRAVPL
jgi:uncharacterized membrane protein